MMVIFNNEKKIHHCTTCDNRTDFSKINLPYACKLLFHELITMNIAPRIITEAILKKEILLKTLKDNT